MRTKRKIVGWLSVFMAAALIFGLLPVVQTAQAVSTHIVISQVYGGGGNAGATYRNDFIELYNLSSAPVVITGWSVQYASATGATWQLTGLTGTIAPGAYYLIQEAAGTGGTQDLPTPNATGTLVMSATAGKVALVNNATVLTGACPTGAGIIDLVGFGLTANCSETNPTPVLSNTTAALRMNNGATDTDNNLTDFSVGTPSPRNTPPPDIAPSLFSSTPANNTEGVAVDANISITFSEPVTATGNWFTLSCANSSSHTADVSGGPKTFTLNPGTDFAAIDTCTLTILADHITDMDGTPDAMVSNAVITFSVGDPCQKTFTPIYDIQGSGAAVAITGSVTTQGVVVGDYEGPAPALRGFFIQDASGDANPATSDGIFVFEGSNANTVALGDLVRVSGTSGENQNQSQITLAGAPYVCSTGSTINPTDVTLPFSAPDQAEQYEGMLVRFPQTLYVTETYLLGRFDQVTLSSGGRLQQPTNVTTPGAAANSLQAANDLNQIILDDASQAQNPDPIVFARGGLPLSASNTLRGGDTATAIVGVFNYTWGGNSASPNAYRVRPTNALNGYVNFEATNPRPTAAPTVGGTLRVVGMNTLNFFNTFDGLPDTVDNCTFGVGGAPADCRGADTQSEFDRQWPKTVAAILKMNPDILGVNEVENDGYAADSAIAFLVDQLNAATAVGTYAFINADANTSQVNALGTDAIKVGLIYKPGVVTPVGQTAVLNSEAFVNGGDTTARSRPSLAQAFEQTSNGARVIVDINHLKSKGGACDTPDAMDGQSNCNAVRLNSAQALVQWLASDPTGTADPDVLLLGDYNSYAMEDPITAIQNGGYTNLIHARIGADAYSYVFNGQWGYLDYAFGSASLDSQITGVGEYHIDADEPTVLDYNTDFKTPGQITSLYAPDEFRVSDHDPVMVGLNLAVGPAVNAGGPYSVQEGQTVTLTATGSAAHGAALTYAWDLDNNGTFETPGQSVVFTAPVGLKTPNSYTVHVQVTDPDSLMAEGTAIITVNKLTRIFLPVVFKIATP